MTSDVGPALTAIYPVLSRMTYDSAYTEMPALGHTGLGTLEIDIGNKVCARYERLARSDIELRPWATLGDDFLGRMLFDTLRCAGMDLSMVRVREGRKTTFVYNLRELTSGEPVSFHSGECTDALPDFTWADAQDADFVYYGSLETFQCHELLLTLFPSTEKLQLPIVCDCRGETDYTFRLIPEANWQSASVVILSDPDCGPRSQFPAIIVDQPDQPAHLYHWHNGRWQPVMEGALASAIARSLNLQQSL
jgi:hypothetical protein